MSWSHVERRKFCIHLSGLKYPTIAITKGSVKENNDSHKTCMYVHDISLYQTSFVLSETVHELSP
jgi:hypothetical protein